jgi:hypothetical protein
MEGNEYDKARKKEKGKEKQTIFQSYCRKCKSSLNGWNATHNKYIFHSENV